MIEYILARPFLLIFGLSTIVFSLINWTSEYKNINSYFELILILFFLLIILFNKRFRFVKLILFIILILFIRMFVHLKEDHAYMSSIDQVEKRNNILIINCANKNSDYYIVDAQIASEPTRPTIRISIPTNDSMDGLFYGDTLNCKFNLDPVKPSYFRYFNSFNNFLLNQHIYYKARLTDSIVVLNKYSSFSILSFSQKLSYKCKKILLNNIPDLITANLMVALLLGDKSTLDKNIKNDFINTGTAHILAVSGLHLGMIYALLNGLIKLFKRRNHSKKYKAIKIIFLLLLIWLFSLISGLSASVVRAAVMLTFLDLGRFLNKNSDSVNSLFCCGFLMIFFNPCTIYDIGFQLSFLAVLSIILFNPYLMRIVAPQNAFLSKIRDLLSVTLSVQILVTPISIYYFQQFPLYFILSNLVWVPLSFLIMIAGILLILTYLIIPIMALWLGQLCIYLCKSGLIWFDLIRKLPASKFEGLWIYPEEVTIYLFSAIFIFLWLKFRNPQLLYISICAFILFPIIHFGRLEMINSSNELIIYTEGKTLHLDIRTGTTMYTSNMQSKIMKNYRSAHNISSVQLISDSVFINNLLNKNGIGLTSQVNDNNFNFKESIIIHYPNPKDPEHICLTTLITKKSRNPFYRSVTYISNEFNGSIHDANIDGPFTLKFKMQ